MAAMAGLKENNCYGTVIINSLGLISQHSIDFICIRTERIVPDAQWGVGPDISWIKEAKGQGGGRV